MLLLIVRVADHSNILNSSSIKELVGLFFNILMLLLTESELHRLPVRGNKMLVWLLNLECQKMVAASSYPPSAKYLGRSCSDD